jgi:hypothetical protein
MWCTVSCTNRPALKSSGRNSSGTGKPASTNTSGTCKCNAAASASICARLGVAPASTSSNEGTPASPVTPRCVMSRLSTTPNPGYSITWTLG